MSTKLKEEKEREIKKEMKKVKENGRIAKDDKLPLTINPKDEIMYEMNPVIKETMVKKMKKSSIIEPSVKTIEKDLQILTDNTAEVTFDKLQQQITTTPKK